MKRRAKPDNIYQKVIDSIDAGEPFVLATILGSDGSTPRKAGVKAVIDQTGRIWGTLGGGAVEAETQRRAIEVCKTGLPTIIEIELEGKSRADDTPICGGTVRILIDPTVAKNRTLYAELDEAIALRQRGVLLTTVCHGEKLDVTSRWLGADAIPSETGFPDAENIGSCLAREDVRLISEDTGKRAREVLVEPIFPKPLLLIVGGGHIGQSLARQAKEVGFDITVLDDRSQFAQPELFPEGISTLCGRIGDEISRFPIESDTYIVIVTWGHQHDAEALEACIHSKAAYVGMIGSKRKIALIRKDFIDSVIATAEQFDRVFAPIGVDIGSVTVPEIAASIVAELIAVRRRGVDWALESRKGPK
ncbi:MAG: XdhC family protein [Planctomycetota bacterium]|jgi:xanthine dehydrogenase accessory factor